MQGISQPHQASDHDFIDYVSFQVPNEPFSDIANCIGILRGFMHDMSGIKKGYTSLEAVLLSVPSGYHCVDLSLYKVGPKTYHTAVQSFSSNFLGCPVIFYA